MIAEKARLFGDDKILNRILSSTHPRKAQQLEREVEHYDEEVWYTHRPEIATVDSTAKFSQNEAIKTFLLNTGDRVLV